MFYRVVSARDEGRVGSAAPSFFLMWSGSPYAVTSDWTGVANEMEINECGRRRVEGAWS